MGSGINSIKWNGIRDPSTWIWDYKPWDRDQWYCKRIRDPVIRGNIRDPLKILKRALIGGTKSCYITSQPSQIRADIKSDRILANRQEVNSVCARVYNIAIPPPPLPPTLWFSYTNIISRGFNNHRRPTKLVGYVSQRSRPLFPPKKQLVWIMSWTKIEFVHAEVYIT